MVITLFGIYHINAFNKFFIEYAVYRLFCKVQESKEYILQSKRGSIDLKSPIANRVDTIFVHVKALEKSIHWYSKLLGLEVEDGDYSGPVYTISMGDGRPGLTLDNHCFDDIYEFVPSNQPIFSLSASDINTAYQYVRNHLNAEIVTEIQIFPDLADFTFKDPDGNIIMICNCFT